MKVQQQSTSGLVVDTPHLYKRQTRGINDLINRLHKVKQTGQGRYIACCPAHDDKHPSLAIRDDNGTILLRCFAGCSAFEIVAAVGMEISDLFPGSGSFAQPMKNPFPAADILRCIQSEAMIVAIAACDIAKGLMLSDSDKQRILLAASRIGGAYE